MVGKVAVVDYDGNVVMNKLVKPDVEVVSCLTELTGTTTLAPEPPCGAHCAYTYHRDKGGGLE